MVFISDLKKNFLVISLICVLSPIIRNDGMQCDITKPSYHFSYFQFLNLASQLPIFTKTFELNCTKYQ